LKYKLAGIADELIDSTGKPLAELKEKMPAMFRLSLSLPLVSMDMNRTVLILAAV
jgi:hypothetical protein